MAGTDRPITGQGDGHAVAHMSSGLRKVPRLVLDGAAQLLLLGFALIIAYLWLDSFILNKAVYDRMVGSEAACGISWAYCSWRDYVWSLLTDTGLALAGIVAFAWRRLKGSAWALRSVALIVFCKLGWQVADAFVAWG